VTLVVGAVARSGNGVASEIVLALAKVVWAFRNDEREFCDDPVARVASQKLNSVGNFDNVLVVECSVQQRDCVRFGDTVGLSRVRWD
jgi:hypothetical protein